MYNYIIQFKLWSQVQRPADPNKFYEDCWLWTGNTRGGSLQYGHLQHRRVDYSAHRVAYELGHETKIPEGLVVRHKCDNPLCCNPLHLETGTQQDNMADKHARRRHACGKSSGAYTKPECVLKCEKHARATLTNDQVLFVRWARDQKRQGWSAVVAKMFEVDHHMLSRIGNRKSWCSLLDRPDYIPPAELEERFNVGVVEWQRKRADSISKAHAEAPVPAEVLDYVLTIRWCYASSLKPGWVKALAAHYDLSTKCLGDIGSRLFRKNIPDDPAFTPRENILQLLRDFIKTPELASR